VATYLFGWLRRIAHIQEGKMCGILGIFDSSLHAAALRKLCVNCSLKQRHRGPDWSGYYSDRNHVIAHERLGIMDPISGAQPIVSHDQNIIVAANGEIYNYQELYDALPISYQKQTGSDCEIIIPLYEIYGPIKCAQMLRGMFAIIIYDKTKNCYYAFRDHLGKCPLYLGHGTDGSTWIASEMKTLSSQCSSFQSFPPGYSFSSQSKEFLRWYEPTWMIPYQTHTTPTAPYDPTLLRDGLIHAVKRRMMSDVPWGLLLSGGLDSSLIASIACRLHREQYDLAQSSSSPSSSPYQPLHSFCIGLENSPDLIAAQNVATHLGTHHHTCHFTIQEGLDALCEVIYHLETYDITTVRASTPMYLLSRKISALGLKMVLSGEGADELFGGYLYFHKAPNPQEFYEETCEKVNNLHLYDCLRANKSTASWGIECRTPFLDEDFLEIAMNVNPQEKMITEDKRNIEKYILRAAFDFPEQELTSPVAGVETCYRYLPKEILWRQKEQFSDGVGYGWIDSLRAYAEILITDTMFESAKYRFEYGTPKTKEAYLYRSIFEEYYPQHHAIRTVPVSESIACSTPRALNWDQSFRNRADASGRSVGGVHTDSYDAAAFLVKA
jgi:asparagine synthase (glutamine-hydrolysing)